jgi:hypothetical protein
VITLTFEIFEMHICHTQDVRARVWDWRTWRAIQTRKTKAKCQAERLAVQLLVSVRVAAVDRYLTFWLTDIATADIGMSWNVPIGALYCISSIQ